MQDICDLTRRALGKSTPVWGHLPTPRPSVRGFRSSLWAGVTLRRRIGSPPDGQPAMGWV